MISWTTPSDIKAYVLKCWDNGRILSGEIKFPLTVPFKAPNSKELVNAYGKVLEWSAQLQKKQESSYTIGFGNVASRNIGATYMPVSVTVETLEDALNMIGKKADFNRFESMKAITNIMQPYLLNWLLSNSIKALLNHHEWETKLKAVEWISINIDSNLFIREVDIPGMGTKFIETHKMIIGLMVDALIPEIVIHRPTTPFSLRYGFKTEGNCILMRILDASKSFFGITTISTTIDQFENMRLPIKNVFVVENKTNFLVFPDVPDSIVILGSGYAVGGLKRSHWLHDTNIYYWGDLDTHGFSILNKFRKIFPKVISFLMDKETIDAHQQYLLHETKCSTDALNYITTQELEALHHLSTFGVGKNRIEQEYIKYGHLKRAIANF